MSFFIAHSSTLIFRTVAARSHLGRVVQKAPRVGCQWGFRSFVPRHYATSRHFRHQRAAANPYCLARVQGRAGPFTAISGPGRRSNSAGAADLPRCGPFSGHSCRSGRPRFSRRRSDTLEFAFSRSHLINRKGVAFAQDRQPPERLSGIFETASSLSLSSYYGGGCLLTISRSVAFLTTSRRTFGKSIKVDTLPVIRRSGLGGREQVQ